MIMFNNQNLFAFLFFVYGTSLCLYPLLKTKVSPRFYVLYNFSLLLSQCIALISTGFSIILEEHSYVLIAHSLSTFTDVVIGGVALSITPLSFYFSVLVLAIGCSTNLYILSYFRSEADEMSFIFWLNAFVFSMLFLVLSSNFYALFLGWELIGLTSFFLINF